VFWGPGLRVVGRLGRRSGQESSTADVTPELSTDARRAVADGGATRLPGRMQPGTSSSTPAGAVPAGPGPTPAGPPGPADRRRALGAFGEAYAARHLVQQGMVVLDRNWRCDAGEIDLVLRDDRVLVVCEVKTRSSTAFGSPVEGVTEAKAQRLRRLAGRWVEAHELRPAEIRIDVVGVLAAPGRPPVIDHVRGIG